MRPYCVLVDNWKTIHVWLPLTGQGYSAKGVLTINKDLLSALRALRRLYGLSRRHQPSTRTPERFPQHVEHTEFRRPGTLSLPGIFIRQPPRSPGLHLFTRSAPSVLYADASAVPQLPSLFRRCSETTIHLRTIAIPLSDPSKFWESAKSAKGDVRLEGWRYSLD